MMQQQQQHQSQQPQQPHQDGSHPPAHHMHHHHQHIITGPNPELLPGPERAYYDHLFQEALAGQQQAHGGGGGHFLHGPAAVAFLSRSGLPKPALRQVSRWDWTGSKLE